MGTIGYSVKNRSRYPSLVLSTVLGEGMSSRLFQRVRERHGLAYNIFSFANTMSDTGNFGVYLATDAHHVDRAIDIVRRELEKIKAQGVGPAELQRTKSQIKGTMMLGLESMSSRMMRLGSVELYYGENVPFDEVIREVDAVTAADVAGIARDLLRLDDFSMVIIRPLNGKQFGSAGVVESPRNAFFTPL